MRPKLVLGQGIGFNLDLLLRGRLLVQGSSGSGKSETVKKICAATQDQMPSIIIDPGRGMLKAADLLFPEVR